MSVGLPEHLAHVRLGILADQAEQHPGVPLGEQEALEIGVSWRDHTVDAVLTHDALPQGVVASIATP